MLGTGTFVEVKLKPGEHTITVMVDDGTNAAADSFTVVVKKEEESPEFDLVAAMAALVMAGLVRVRWKG